MRVAGGVRCGLQGGACTAERKKPTDPKPAEVERSSGRASQGSYSRLPRWRTWFGSGLGSGDCLGGAPGSGQGWGQGIAPVAHLVRVRVRVRAGVRGRGGVRAKCEGRGLG